MSILPVKNFIGKIEQEKKGLLWIAVFITFIAVLAAYNIVHDYPYLWVALLVFFLILAILKSHTLGFYMIAVSVFFADWLAGLGIIPAQVSMLPEIVILLYFLKSLMVKPKRFNPKFFLLFTPFLLTSLISLIMNLGEDPAVTVILGFRSLFRYVILFYGIQILPMPDREIRRFIKFLLFLLMVQIPVAVIKLFIYGQGESAIGTYGVSGGVNSTILPMIGISFFFGIFYFVRRSFWPLLACAGFLAFGIIGGKRGILFMIPLLVVYLFLNLPRSSRFRRSAVTYAALFILLGLSIWAPIRYLSTLREDPLGYAMNYEFATSGDQTIGRMSTSMGIFSLLSTEAPRFFFGYGPGSFHEALWAEYVGRIRRDSGSYGIRYGVTGLSWSALEFGYLGAFLFLIPIIYLYVVARRFFRSTDDPFWKAAAFGFGGILFSSLVIYLFYADFYRFDIPAFILFFLGGQIYKKEAHGRLWGVEEASSAESSTGFSLST